MTDVRKREIALGGIWMLVEQHPAVTHPLIKMLSRNPNDMHAWQTFARHHHWIVRTFPSHVYRLFQRLPLNQQVALFPVLSDEFPPGMVSIVDGEIVFAPGDPDFSAHAGLQLELCRSLGVGPAEVPLTGVGAFIHHHRVMAAEGPTDFMLGVFGPGHEAAVPMMFRQLVSGAPPTVNPTYMFEHLTIDVEHAARFREVLVHGDIDLAAVRRGAMWSLDLRAAAWDDILHAIQATRP